MNINFTPLSLPPRATLECVWSQVLRLAMFTPVISINSRSNAYTLKGLARRGGSWCFLFYSILFYSIPNGVGV